MLTDYADGGISRSIFNLSSLQLPGELKHPKLDGVHVDVFLITVIEKYMITHIMVVL